MDMTKALGGLLASLMLLPQALAQEEALEETPQIRRYTVEIVVFAYAEDMSVGTEVFPADELPVAAGDPLLDDALRGADGELVFADERISAAGIVEDDPATELPSVEDDGSGTLAAEGTQRPPLAAIEPVLMLDDEFSMQRIADQLERLDAYDPIMHVGWTQATLPRDESPAIELDYFGDPPPGLDGSFTLYLGRYLHLVVDLQLDADIEDENAKVAESRRDDQPMFGYGQGRTQYEFEEQAPLKGPVRYRIQDNRIIKNGEIRYFDHPKFGVIAKIERVAEPVEQEEDPASPDSVQLFSHLTN